MGWHDEHNPALLLPWKKRNSDLSIKPVWHNCIQTDEADSCFSGRGIVSHHPLCWYTIKVMQSTFRKAWTRTTVKTMRQTSRGKNKTKQNKTKNQRSWTNQNLINIFLLKYTSGIKHFLYFFPSMPNISSWTAACHPWKMTDAEH